jgi:glycosyltransferase involved in cell wall biosynthesis
MMDKKYNILVISSYPPGRSGGIAQDNMDALLEDGHIVDFFTMYAFAGQKENQYSILPEPFTDKLVRLKKKFPLLAIFQSLAKIIFPTPEKKMSFVEKHGYRIPHLDETKPPVDDRTLSAALPNNKYDFIQVFVTERMLTTVSFLTIYRRYQVPLLITCMDMLHFTGGCYFFGECNRFTVGCGKCLVLDSDDEIDQTHKNFMIKKDVYSKIQYAILCNLHQKKFALGCKLFNPDNIFTNSIIIDEDKFVQHDENLCRKELGIPCNKKFVILSRYQKGLARSKGYDHLVNIVNTYAENATRQELDSSILVLIGSKDEQFASQFKMDTLCLGRLDLNDLIKSYSAASVFISTSIDDAGPSMVNQSMMCATPVVTFSIGTALEVTREGVNGHMADNFDDNDFVNKIFKISRLTKDEFTRMRRTTRESALAMNSKHANAERIIEIYQETMKIYNN